MNPKKILMRIDHINETVIAFSLITLPLVAIMIDAFFAPVNILWVITPSLGCLVIMVWPQCKFCQIMLLVAHFDGVLLKCTVMTPFVFLVRGAMGVGAMWAREAKIFVRTERTRF